MIDRQLRARGVRDEAVLAAMARVPRHRFVPPAHRAEAYARQRRDDKAAEDRRTLENLRQQSGK